MNLNTIKMQKVRYLKYSLQIYLIYHKNLLARYLGHSAAFI